VDTQLEEIVLAGQARTETLVDAFEISSDLYVKRRADTGELQVIDHAHRRCALLERLLHDERTFLTKGETEGSRVVAMHRGYRSTEDTLDGIEGSRRRTGCCCSTTAFDIQGDTLDSPFI